MNEPEHAPLPTNASARPWGETELLTIRRVSEILDVHPSTVRRHMAAGRLAHFKIDHGQVRVPGFAVDKLLGELLVEDALGEQVTETTEAAR